MLNNLSKYAHFWSAWDENIYYLFISYVIFSCMVQAFKNVLDKFVGVNLESWKPGVRWDAKWTL